jgi:uncharacterized protein YjbJ (UPF0337 family)
MTNHNRTTDHNHATETAIEQQTEGNWNQLKGRIQEAWGVLTDDDVDRYEGKRDRLIGSIQEKTGQAHEAVTKTLDELARKVRYTFNPTKIPNCSSWVIPMMWVQMPENSRLSTEAGASIARLWPATHRESLWS